MPTMNPFLVRALSRASSPPIRRHAAAVTAAAAPALLYRSAIPRPSSFVNLLLVPRGCPSAARFHTRVGGGVGNKGSQMPRRPAPPPEAELDEAFLKGSGPGGQKINKTNSAVQLRHRPTGIVIKCQATRSRTENRKIARQLLADRLDALARGDESRAAVVGEWRAKKRASSAKKSRRKYRKLDEEKAAAAAAAAPDDDPHADPVPLDEDLLTEQPLDQALEDGGHGNGMGEPEEREQRPRPTHTEASQGET